MFKPTLIAASVLACSAALAASKQTASTTHGATVSTFPSPMIGWGTKYDGSDTLTGLPSFNLNYSLLKHHSQVASHTGLLRPQVNLGGKAEVTGTYTQNVNSGKYDHSFDLTAATLDMNVDAGQWVNGFISYGKDDEDIFAPTAVGIQQAFVTFGNLNKSPVFATFGKMYAPFVRHAGYLITDTLTQQAGQLKATMAELGFAKKGWLVEAYGYQSPFMYSKKNDSSTEVNGGVEVQYGHQFNAGKFTIGAGYLSQVLDAAGYRNVAPISSFPGYGDRSGAVDVHARFNAKHFDLIAEGMMVLKNINYTDAFDPAQTYKTTKKAFVGNAQAFYKFSAQGKPWAVGLGYGFSQNAQDLNTAETGYMPKQRISAALQTSLVKNTVETLQYSHDTEYTSGGQIGLPAKDSANIIEAQLDLYF